MTKTIVKFFHARVPSNRARTKGSPTDDELHAYSRNLGWWKRDAYGRTPMVSPSPKGGRTVCLIKEGRRGYERTVAIGEAYCSFSDNFSYKRGRDIAYGRAMASRIQEESEVKVKVFALSA